MDGGHQLSSVEARRRSHLPDKIEGAPSVFGGGSDVMANTDGAGHISKILRDYFAPEAVDIAY